MLFGSMKCEKCSHLICVHTEHDGCTTPGCVCEPPSVGKHSWVYFIQCETGQIKIGTSIDPYKRVDQLQTGSAARLMLLAQQPGDERLESWLHEHFRSSRTTGEWFRPDAKLLMYIVAIAP